MTGELAPVNRVLHDAGVGVRLWITGPDYDVTCQPRLTGPRAGDAAVRFFLIALYGLDQGVQRAYFYNWGGAKIPVVLQVEGKPPTPAALAVDRLRDVFYVNAHCTYRGQRHSWGISFTERGGSHGKWVQVHNDQHYYIKQVTC
ncbi:hypothetical protein [Streptomyces bugieae]|uniref:Uncharacterized protein n=1 Tax=Streptomyces bugieae TaxID=3098223 RepID=A0ABU7NIN0_9ACTN|nr:hypothetical protein [Streptomyces sp. DSM 41528]